MVFIQKKKFTQGRELVFSILCLVLGQFPNVLHAQQTAYFSHDLVYRKALELYDHQSYAGASKLFEQVYLHSTKTQAQKSTLEEDGLQGVNARFYKALCEMKLGNRVSEDEMTGLINTYPYAPMSHTVALEIGFYHFQQGDYAGAISRLKDISESSLIREEQDELNFKYGFSLFKLKQTTDASTHFSRVDDHKNTYQDDAIYYRAHIDYENKEYNVALAELKKLPAGSKYLAIYPVYVSQIYLLRGDIDSAILLTKPLTEQATSPYLPLLSKTLGSAYFFKEKYAEAAKAFNVFKESNFANQETHQDNYQIGYSYYENGEYEKAIKELSQLYDQHDVYAQSGLYALGQCFLKTGQNPNARSAFQLASQLNGDVKITENALVYYIKLSYEAGLDQDALSAAAAFVKNYPRSSAITEVKTLQANVLMHAHNYEEAYETLKSIPDRNNQAETAFQKVSYFYGIENFNNTNYPQAKQLFDESLQHDVLGNFVLLARYWKAEACFNLKQYDESIQGYQNFLSTPGALSSADYKDSFYGSGYAYFKKEDYTRALSGFEKYVQLMPKDEVMKDDARMRMADCYFMLKSYVKAKEQYTTISTAKGAGADYAMFQSAMIQGLQKNTAAKLAMLTNLLHTYPNSAYGADAGYEIAYAHFVGGNLKLSQDEFTALISRYPQSSYVPRSLMNIGLIYYNSNDDKNALQYYQQVVKNYPGSPESKNSLAAIRNIFVDQGNPDGFVAYANSTGMPVSQTGEDSISYQAASTRFANGDNSGSLTSFDAYLQKFPSGYFASEAHFYRSQALQNLKKPEEALPDYEFLINKSTNSTFTENALVNAAGIYLVQQKWDTALPYYKRLEQYAQDRENYSLATSGLATCYFQMNQPDSCLFYTAKVIGSTKSTVQQTSHANLLAGKSFLIKADTTQSLKPLGLTAKGRNIDAAEARYLLAFIQFKAKNFKASMKTLFELVKQLPGYDYWVAKSFVLLADNYTATGDIFQARSTLISIIRNYKPDDEVKNSANLKLSQLQRIKK